MSAEQKNAWKCPDCINKIPKGNNTNTPLRPPQSDITLSHNTSSPSCTNVTLRNKRCTNSTLALSNDENMFEISKADLKDIIRHEIKNAVHEAIADQLKGMNDLLSSFQQSLSFFNDQFETMKSSLVEKSVKIQELEKVNNNMQASIGDLTKRLNIMEQHSRSCNIELQNVPENRSENLISLITQLGRITNYEINDSDVLHCSRIAKLDAASKRPRSIIVKFTTPRFRDSCLAAVMKFNRANKNNKLNSSHLGIATDKPQPIYVMEHLSAANKAIHAATRIHAKELGFKYVWTRNGRIFMRKDDTTQSLVINSTDMLKSVK